MLQDLQVWIFFARNNNVVEMQNLQQGVLQVVRRLQQICLWYQFQQTRKEIVQRQQQSEGDFQEAYP